MSSCDHHTWLQIVHAKKPAICDTGRLSRLLPELRDPTSQKPTLLFFVGHKAKDTALRELFPWNNVRKGVRTGIASLRVDTTTTESKFPVLFAESDPFAAVTSPVNSMMSCHTTKSFPLEWNGHTSNDLFDLIHGRLFCIFADIVCIFAEDFADFDAVVDRLKAWSSFGKASTQLKYVKPKVIIVKKGIGPSPSPTYDLLERLDVQFSLLQQSLVEFFSSIIVLHLADEQISSLARHRRLKELIRRQMTEMRELRQCHGCAYTAIHLSHFFTQAVPHTARTIDEPFDFLLSSRQPTSDNTEHLTNFFNLCRPSAVTNDTTAAYVASSLLLDAYRPGIHSKTFVCMIDCTDD